MSAVTRQRTCLVQGRTISYREAGDVSAPAILLLHGPPGSSAEYDTLIRALADKFHLIAPTTSASARPRRRNPAYSPTPSRT